MKNVWGILWRKLAVVGGMIVACTASTAGNIVWYVDSSSHGSQDGQSWQTAFNSLQSALSKSKSGDEIWVAKGIYYPDAGNRNTSFEMKENVALYGGFTGTETSINQRDYTKNPTILSGNIGNGDKSNNTVTILKGANNAVLDGFTVSDAYSTDKAKMHLVPSDIRKNDMAVGGGMRNFKASPIVRNCIFKNNYSPKGGAVYNMQDASAVQAQFINVTFIDNTAQIRGGAVSNDLGAMPVFINCKFLRNVSQDKGGALYNDFAASPVLLNCTFQSNSAVSAGAMGNDGGSSPLLVNVTIAGNHASSGMGGGLYQGTGAQNNPVVINSSVDNIYNWHEDIVSTLNSAVPAGQSIPLKDFIPVSSFKGVLDASDIAGLPDTPKGYQEKLDGSTLLDNALVGKLIKIYAKNGGAVNYCNTYQRPEITGTVSTQPVIYVVPESSSALQDGSSWKSAMTDLQQAINKASVNKASVWIKAGTYRQDGKTGQIAAFVLYDGVKLYGGFSGSEKSADERDAANNATILSAGIKDGSYCYPHVLYGADNVILDGLTIRDGKADGFTYNGKGGGLLAYHAGKTYVPLSNDPGVGFIMQINNCCFVDNQALEGGAIYAFAKGGLTISNTTFKDNKAVYGGAVLSREGNKFSYDNCIFSSNQASSDGGAAYEDYGAHATYKNCTFSRNSAKFHGGAIYVISRASQLEATVVNIEKCSFEKNQAPYGESLFDLDQSKITITNSNLDISAMSADFKQVNSGVKYQLIGKYSVERLNKILTGELAEFSSFPMTYPSAKNPVTLYKVIYNTVIPEDNNRPVQVSGLIAVPDVDSTTLPVVSYQHGTVFSRYEVPSNIEKSMETRMIIARFAGQGYIVIAADYIGKGVSGEPDSWLVKESTAQACLDMLLASRAICSDLKITPAELFLSGWSQGSFSTSAFLNRLEKIGIPVKAAAFASAPNDIYLCVNRWIHVSSKLDVNWLVATAAMLVNSYENYYKLTGLTAAAVKPEYLQTVREFCANRMTWEEAEKKLPSKVRDLYQEEFINQGSLVSNRFFQQLQLNSSYNWRFSTPTYFYYGAIDEVVTPYMVQLPVEYQRTLGAARAQAIFAGENANHRGTFVFAVSDQKKQFDELLKAK